MEWDLTNDKAKLSEVVDVAFAEGPQTIVVGGRRLTVTPQSPRDDDAELRSAMKFKEWLLNGPSLEGVDLERDKSPMREIEF